MLLLLTFEKLLDILTAELGTLYDRMADAREHFLESGADLTLADLLGALLDPFRCLIHFGLVGGIGRPGGQSDGREEHGGEPQPAQSAYHDAPPSVKVAHGFMLPPGTGGRSP